MCGARRSADTLPRVSESDVDDWPTQRRAIVQDSLAVGLATGAYGTGFGAISVASGLSIGQTCALSLLMFTGASQFAFVGVLAAGGTSISASATALLLGSRNALYGLRMAPLLGYRGRARVGAAHLLIDESTAMGVTRESQRAARTGFLTTGIAIFILWNFFTLIGAVAGDLIGDPRVYGLDAAVGAAFLALLWPRLSQRRNMVVALLAAALALMLVGVVPAGVPVLAAAGVALLAGLMGGRADDQVGEQR